jgi:hypothetical protein
VSPLTIPEWQLKNENPDEKKKKQELQNGKPAADPDLVLGQIGTENGHHKTDEN